MIRNVMASRGEGAKARRAGKAGDTRRKAEEEVSAVMRRTRGRNCTRKKRGGEETTRADGEGDNMGDDGRGGEEGEEEEEGDEEGEEEGREAGAASGLIPVSSTHLMARPGAGADIGISPARVEARHPLLRWEFESEECSEC